MEKQTGKASAQGKTKPAGRQAMKKKTQAMLGQTLDKYALLTGTTADDVHGGVYTDEEGRMMLQHLQRRTLAQNACMWALLTDISQQVNWCGSHLTKEEWKHLLAVSLKRRRTKQQGKQNSGASAGTALNTASNTSSMNIEEMAEFIDYIVLFGLMHGVVFTGSQERLNGTKVQDKDKKPIAVA